MNSLLLPRSLAIWGLFAVLGPEMLAPPLALAQEKAAASSEEAKKSFADAANLQNNNAFDVAIEEWDKFLKNYPKDPLAPKAQHYLSVCQLQLKKYDKAAAN